MEIHLAHTQGFCAGVSMAMDTVRAALEKFGAPLYVRHHIVHNNAVIRDFEEQGVIFIEDIADVPEGKPVVLSAHGVAPGVYANAKTRGVQTIDATCPLVTKVHREAKVFSAKGIQTILIGHRGHQELVGTSGYVNPDLLHIVEDDSDIASLNLDPTRPIGYLTQTTLSVSETKVLIEKLKQKYPEIIGPPKEDICYATQNRQDAVLTLAKHCDLIIICGSPHSSNSNRLKETAQDAGVMSCIIDTPEEVNLDWFDGKTRVGISSGASVPRYIVDAVVTRIQTRYPEATVHEEESVEKDIAFRMPKF